MEFATNFVVVGDLHGRHPLGISPPDFPIR